MTGYTTDSCWDDLVGELKLEREPEMYLNRAYAGRPAVIVFGGVHTVFAPDSLQGDPEAAGVELDRWARSYGFVRIPPEPVYRLDVS